MTTDYRLCTEQLEQALEDSQAMIEEMKALEEQLRVVRAENERLKERLRRYTATIGPNRTEEEERQLCDFLKNQE